jgi:glyceraldehyde 3-phosphate dehydrogenase
MAHLLKYDSIHGVLPQGRLRWERNSCRRETFYVFHEKISNLPWKSLDINYVIEATGKYFEDLNAHIIAGKKVILSALR